MPLLPNATLLIESEADINLSGYTKAFGADIGYLSAQSDGI